MKTLSKEKKPIVYKIAIIELGGKKKKATIIHTPSFLLLGMVPTKDGPQIFAPGSIMMGITQHLVHLIFASPVLMDELKRQLPIDSVAVTSMKGVN